MDFLKGLTFIFACGILAGAGYEKLMLTVSSACGFGVTGFVAILIHIFDKEVT